MVIRRVHYFVGVASHLHHPTMADDGIGALAAMTDTEAAMPGGDNSSGSEYDIGPRIQSTDNRTSPDAHPASPRSSDASGDFSGSDGSNSVENFDMSPPRKPVDATTDRNSKPPLPFNNTGSPLKATSLSGSGSGSASGSGSGKRKRDHGEDKHRDRYSSHKRKRDHHSERHKSSRDHNHRSSYNDGLDKEYDDLEHDRHNAQENKRQRLRMEEVEKKTLVTRVRTFEEDLQMKPLREVSTNDDIEVIREQVTDLEERLVKKHGLAQLENYVYLGALAAETGNSLLLKDMFSLDNYASHTKLHMGMHRSYLVQMQKEHGDMFVMDPMYGLAFSMAMSAAMYHNMTANSPERLEKKRLKDLKKAGPTAAASTTATDAIPNTPVPQASSHPPSQRQAVPASPNVPGPDYFTAPAETPTQPTSAQWQPTPMMMPQFPPPNSEADKALPVEDTGLLSDEDEIQLN